MSEAVTLREHLDQRFDDLEKRLEDRWAAERRALGLAERNIEGRLEKLNELRQQVATDRSEYMNREVAEGRLSRMEAWQSKATGALVVIAGIGVANLVKLWTG